MELAVVVSNANKGVNAYDTIDAIKSAGFENVFIQWYNRVQAVTQEEQLKHIRKKGLKVIFAHLGYQNINDLWLDTEDGDRLIKGYKHDIKICKENGIDMVVMHLSATAKAPSFNETGLKRLQELADCAMASDMKIAFENTRQKGYLEYVTENIKNKNIGICFDSGHYHAHFDDDFDFSKFKDRIFAVHLHDNDKSADQHLIPFEGTIDWNKIIKELKLCNYTGPITLELCYRNEYLNINIEEFYKKGYLTAEKLKKMFEDQM